MPVDLGASASLDLPEPVPHRRQCDMGVRPSWTAGMVDWDRLQRRKHVNAETVYQNMSDWYGAVAGTTWAEHRRRAEPAGSHVAATLHRVANAWATLRHLRQGYLGLRTFLCSKCMAAFRDSTWRC